jgi:nicotinamide-nucleotide amidase
VAAEPVEVTDTAAQVVELLVRRRLGIAVAESLTGGLLTAELVRIPGVSAVLRGGVVAYDTAVKASVLGVDAELLHEHGPVHPEVAEQMADGVRHALAVDGEPAAIGIATTGVAGPGPQDGHPAGTVFLGFALGDRVRSTALTLTGDRAAIRAAAVSESLSELLLMLRE